MTSSLVSPVGPLPQGWKLAKLKDIATKLGSGATPRGGASVYLPSRTNCALVRSQNVYDRRFDSSSLSFISDEHAEELGNVALQPSDLLLNITGDGVTFGRACLVPEEILPARVNQHVAIIRLRQDVCLPGYLLSYLTHPAVKSYIESFNSGGSRRAITKGNIESFLIPIPPIAEQRAIDRVLSALDRKIELSSSMNQTLETMARAIFKSWFVDFEPVRDGTPWSSKTGKVEDLALLSRESMTPEDYPDEVFDHYSIPAFDEGKVAKAESGEGIKSNKFVVVDGAILLSKLNPRIPRVWLPNVAKGRRSICSTEFLVVLPRRKPEDREYLYSFFCSSEFVDRFSSRTTGTSGSHQRVRPDDLMNMECPVPEAAARDRYSQTVRPIFAKIAQNLEESRTLAAIRDTLLPKLLSGEIRIKQAEKIVGEAV